MKSVETVVPGPLCKRGHDDGTGHSLRYASTRMCLCCLRERPRLRDRERERAQARRYYWEHRDQELEQMAAYRKTEAFKNSARASRERNYERYLEQQRTWKRTPRGQAVMRALNSKMAAARRGMEVGTYTADDLLQLWDDHDGRCGYCGIPADTVDHMTPRARGGPDALENMVPACAPCNRRKHTKTAEEYLTFLYGGRTCR
jgi:5-methylcytosine-specific restriction endonuclease McrA